MTKEAFCSKRPVIVRARLYGRDALLVVIRLDIWNSLAHVVGRAWNLCARVLCVAPKMSGRRVFISGRMRWGFIVCVWLHSGTSASSYRRIYMLWARGCVLCNQHNTTDNREQNIYYRHFTLRRSSPRDATTCWALRLFKGSTTCDECLCGTINFSAALFVLNGDCSRWIRWTSRGLCLAVAIFVMTHNVLFARGQTMYTIYYL